ncbi:MAG: hypothetical protein HYV20_05830, partial [Gemmatimonadetes bacterium]|nr:hypothetical protein [Gemmatimonadota bacterium]
MDKEMYQKAFDRQVLDTMVDFLDARHIDVSDLRDREAVILNTGVIVQGGDVTAQTLAVGTGAQAGVFKRFMTRAGGSAPAPTRGT